jgi:hypothetical protein
MIAIINGYLVVHVLLFIFSTRLDAHTHIHRSVPSSTLIVLNVQP